MIILNGIRMRSKSRICHQRERMCIVSTVSCIQQCNEPQQIQVFTEPKRCKNIVCWVDTPCEDEIDGPQEWAKEDLFVVASKVGAMVLASREVSFLFNDTKKWAEKQYICSPEHPQRVHTLILPCRRTTASCLLPLGWREDNTRYFAVEQTQSKHFYDGMIIDKAQSMVSLSVISIVHL